MFHEKCDEDINQIIPTDPLHPKLSYEVIDAAVDDDCCELSTSDDSKSFCSEVQSNVENVSDNSCQKKRAFSKVTLSRDRKRLKPIDGKVEYLLLDGKFVSVEELSYLTEKVGKNRYENESEMKKKQRLAKAADHMRLHRDNESEMEKQERLAKVAEHKRLKRKYQKSESVMEDNKCDANYDANKYMVRL